MSDKRYFKTFLVRWADCDPNRHLRHSALTDFADHVRLAYLAESGFPWTRFEEEGFGPIIFRQAIRFSAEVELGDTIKVDMRVGHLSKSGRKWSAHHYISRGDGELAAIVSVAGSWLDMKTRRLTQPPADLVATLDRLRMLTEKPPVHRPI